MIFFLFIVKVRHRLIKQMIRSNLLALRPIEKTDDYLLQVLMNNQLISENVVGWTFPVSLFSQAKWIENNVNAANYRLIIIDIETDEPIGITGLWDIDWHNQMALSAIKLIPEKVKKGFGTDAIMLTMAWSFYNVGLRRLYGSILDFNGPSMGAYVKKCGWRVEGRQREAIFRKGQWHDLYNVAILKSDFDKLPNASKYIDYVCPVDTTPNINLDLKSFM